MSSPETFVVAVVATAHRTAELARLFRSLAAEPPFPGAVVVVDNGGEAETRRLVEESPLLTAYLAPGRNLGCGGGHAAGGKLALERFAEVTHFWFMDDDCEVDPQTLGTLLAALEKTGAAMACPAVEDGEGILSWFPGLLEAEKFRVLKQHVTPAEYLRRCGPEPVPLSWAQGIALLVTREAVERSGWHRSDYWLRGEDLEFSLRISARAPGIFVPEARVRHLPPPETSRLGGEYLRHAAMLQNLAYTAVRLPHGWRVARTLPGNWWRFLRTWGFTPRVLWEAWRCFFFGALVGWPAGRTYGRAFVVSGGK